MCKKLLLITAGCLSLQSFGVHFEDHNIIEQWLDSTLREMQVNCITPEHQRFYEKRLEYLIGAENLKDLEVEPRLRRQHDVSRRRLATCII